MVSMEGRNNTDGSLLNGGEMFKMIGNGSCLHDHYPALRYRSCTLLPPPLAPNRMGQDKRCCSDWLLITLESEAINEVCGFFFVKIPTC